MKHLLCLGLGFSARALVRRLGDEGTDWRFSGTVRDVDAGRPDDAQAVELIGFDGTSYSRALAEAIGSATHVLVSIPPSADGDPVLQHHRFDIERSLADGPLQWIGYLSTIGVYGDQGGAWVDETTPAQPTSQRSEFRMQAERAWLDLMPITAPAPPAVQVFRLAGIYGRGRSAIDQVRSGRARRIIKPGQVFNRIHVDDIAAVLERAMAGKGRQTVYNLADDEPAPPQDVIALAAELLERPVPPGIPFDEADLSPMAKSFYSELKRVRNDRIKEDLGIALRYPTYREGLAAIAQATEKNG